VLGAIYVRGTQYFLPAQYQLAVTGVGVLLLLMVFPGGLGQIVYSLRDSYLRFVANRRGIEVPSLVADRRVTTTDEILEHVEEEAPPILDDEPELVTT